MIIVHSTFQKPGQVYLRTPRGDCGNPKSVAAIGVEISDGTKHRCMMFAAHLSIEALVLLVGSA